MRRDDELRVLASPSPSASRSARADSAARAALRVRPAGTGRRARTVDRNSRRKLSPCEFASRSTPYRRSSSASELAAGPLARPRAHADRSAYSTSISARRVRNSARSRATYFVKPKKSSARRKKPLCVRTRPRQPQMLAASARCAASVASSRTASLPTVGTPTAAAMPSSKRRLSGPVLADEERDRGRKFERLERTHHGHREREPFVRRLEATPWVRSSEETPCERIPAWMRNCWR